MLEKITIPFEDFIEKLDNNSKILFSGIFGSGKTTFINDFFDGNNDYESIHIYPVNYSIASNEDIFELIKYDILFQLIGKIPKDEFLQVEIPYELTLFAYLVSNKDLESKMDFLTSFLNFASKYGLASLKVYEQLKHLKDKFHKFHNQFQEDDFSKVKDYLEEAVTRKGHIYEEDFFTELIRKLVSKVKEKYDKEFVLVIDDLDRLDPEHIFRILNIFSAHIDFLGANKCNKFDFDKIILVCDYGNLESVFRHKYGFNTDFKGYINKFFDSIYWFESSSLIKEIIGTYLRNIRSDLSYSVFDEEKNLSNLIKTILNIFLDFDIISFRDLISFKGSFELGKLHSNKRLKLIRSNSVLRNYNLNSELVIYFLILFFNNKIELSKAFEKIRNRNTKLSSRFIHEYYLDNIAELVFLINHLYITIENDKPLILEHKTYSFELNIDRNRRDYQIYIECQKVMLNNIVVSHNNLNYFEFLEDAIQVYGNIVEK